MDRIRRSVAILIATAVCVHCSCEQSDLIIVSECDSATMPDGTWDPLTDDAGWDDPGSSDPWFDDMSWDPPYDPGPDGGCTAPPACPTAPADHAVIGQQCIVAELDCGMGFDCFTESVEIFEGETYVSWLGGACSLLGPEGEGCDPGNPGDCPPGATCLELFETDFGIRYFGCLDACSASDTSMNAYDWNCGCREGYLCDMLTEACLPGCSNDRQCCEIWVDENDNYARDAGEVISDPDCTNYCDGNTDDEYPGVAGSETCQASFECINLGDPSASCSGGCVFDSDCPAQYDCLNEFEWTDPDTGEPLYPGGWCVQYRCDLVGRGCSGDCECVNMGDGVDPDFQCVTTCLTSLEPDHPDDPCREGWVCAPYPDSYWYTPSSMGHDGICKPASSCDPDGRGLGEACDDDDQCASPRCLGVCLGFEEAPEFCTLWCNEELAREEAICGAPSSTGGVAPGVCWSGLCLASCTTPHGPVATNDCPQPMACFDNGPAAYGAYSTHADGALTPAGFCFSACLDNMWCSAVFGVTLNCNTTTGQCGM